MCVNNTRPTLPLIGLQWHVTLPQLYLMIGRVINSITISNSDLMPLIHFRTHARTQIMIGRLMSAPLMENHAICNYAFESIESNFFFIFKCPCKYMFSWRGLAAIDLSFSLTHTHAHTHIQRRFWNIRPPWHPQTKAVALETGVLVAALHHLVAMVTAPRLGVTVETMWLLLRVQPAWKRHLTRGRETQRVRGGRGVR